MPSASEKKSSFLHGCASVSQDNIELGGGQGGGDGKLRRGLGELFFRKHRYGEAVPYGLAK